MTKAPKKELVAGVDFVRCNLRAMKADHPDIFDHLAPINEKARAEEIRHLIRLGLMVKNGQLGGAMAMVQTMPAMAAMPTQVQQPHVEQTEIAETEQSPSQSE
ncbi:hypothetical protein HC752_22890 [Vibrio sp. S9_S30]|uniref:hypothetical protein n=1 Tax=Vibrio sp. S9_S30 TaxID=2720226 RepID=UPI0016800466|nr:hypothetical protein [Vibrio sp. S9_S30]MBD1559788.1 hypothetical protein [Vibrio sp. S9_S30]